MALKPIPDGYEGVTPYLIVDKGVEAIEFYTKAFGAKERMRHAAPEGKIGHAELTIGRGLVMLADEYPQMGFRSAKTIGATPVSLHLYVEDVDAVAKRAEAAGAKVIRPLQDQFYGDRSCTLMDPYGHVWTFSTHIEDLTPEEIGARAAKLGGGQG